MTTSLSTSPIQELEITLPNSDQVMSGNVLGLLFLSLLPVNFRFERNQLKLNLSILTHCWNDDFRLRGVSLSEFNNFIRIGIFCCGVCAFLCLTYSYDSLDINRAKKKNMVSLLDVKNVSMNMYVFNKGIIATLLYIAVNYCNVATKSKTAIGQCNH